MNKKQFLYVLTGALVATVVSLGASQGSDLSDFVYQPHDVNVGIEDFHSAHEHQHVDRHDAHYHHTHADAGSHHHNCRATGNTDAQTGNQMLECQDHDGGWKSAKHKQNCVWQGAVRMCS